MTQRRGFTLIELLVAVSVLAIMAGAIFGMYGTTTDAYDRARTGVDRAVLVRALERHFRQVLESAAHSGGGLYATGIEGLDDGSSPDAADSLIVITARNRPTENDLGESNLMKLEYFMGPDGDAEQPGLWVRRQRVLAATDEEETEELLHLAPEAASFEVEYYGAEEWQDEWDPETETELPRLLKITIDFNLEFIRQVPFEESDSDLALDPEEATGPDDRFVFYLRLPSVGFQVQVEQEDGGQTSGQGGGGVGGAGAPPSAGGGLGAGGTR